MPHVIYDTITVKDFNPLQDVFLPNRKRHDVQILSVRPVQNNHYRAVCHHLKLGKIFELLMAADQPLVVE
jgi:hypothetical protein